PQHLSVNRQFARDHVAAGQLGRPVNRHQVHVGRRREQQAALLRPAAAHEQFVRADPDADMTEDVLGQALQGKYPAGPGDGTPQLRDIGRHLASRTTQKSLAEVCPTEVASATIRPANGRTRRMQSWIHVIEWRANVRPDVLALTDDRGAAYPYSELLAQTERRAGGWAALGVGPGDVVAVIAKNSADFLVHAFALM